ncbi:bifunctional oligoribonuclease/PAP phosphatase NrnA [Candidatus Poribacteria bacterium]|nr:MAG: bifunctional oligoribonuclease/PAP phosphatase NrnA [Candidatus Poribacteria bacterium]
MDSFQALLTLFKQYQTFAISTHVNPDGDAIGSELALFLFLEKLGKTVKIFNTDLVPKKYRFLPYWNKIKNAKASTNFCPEVLVILDASSRERIGSFLSKSLIPTHAVINIDHHVTAEAFGDYNIIIPTASSTAEIIYKFIKSTQIPIDEVSALCLYTGIMFDTGCFRYSNATSETHRIAADLIEIGDFAPDEIYRHVYEHIPLGKIHLLGQTLRTLELTSDGKIAWILVTQSMLKETKTTMDDVEGFVKQIQAIESVEVAICVCELPNGKTKVSLRSEGRVNVAALAAEFNGGGHERASGCRINLPYASAIKALVASAKQHIEENC